MPITGSGLGDDWGSQTYLGPRELETTAAVVVNKEALAIVADTIVMSFTKMASGLWNYNATSSQPELSHPLETIRSATLGTKDDDSNWGKFYDDLVKQMPAETAARLLREKEKAKEDRDPSYTALDQFLTSAAKGLAFIESASEIGAPTSISLRNQALNLALPSILAENFGKNGEFILNEAEKFLDNLGPNDPHYDKLTNNLDQGRAALKFMQGLNKGG